MLPALREELVLYPGPTASDGAPTWSLHDPVRNLFFRIDWLSFEILSRWALNDAQAILDAVGAETTIEMEADDVDTLLRFLAENELLQRHDAEGSAWFHQQRVRRQSGWWQQMLHHYLFFRVPLWRPDAFLTATVGTVAPLYSRTFRWLTLAALGIGLIEVSRQWQVFVASLVDTFSIAGLVAFLVTLIGVKFCHELGHAYTAKRYGCRVPTMGIAFLVLFPMAYTDVNDVWKLPDRRRRLYVGAAGVGTELMIAVWALLAWTVLPDGHLRNAAFVLATATWVSTVLINASPFLRFDGYFLLMDWLDMPNLHQRAFALGKWRLRELLFRFDAPPPEYFSPRRVRWLIGFAWLTWLYRLVVFAGIAALVYYVFPKPLGPFLAAVELIWFIGLPIWRELQVWGKSMQAIRRSRRFGAVLLVLMGGVLLISLPWDGRVRSQGVLRPVAHFVIFAPAAAKLQSVEVNDGAKVVEGDSLLVLEGGDLGYQRQIAAAQLALLRWQEEASGLDASLRERQQVLAATRRRLESELTAIDDTLSRLMLRAPFDGVVRLVPDLRPGVWVAENERLGTVSSPARWQVETYLYEADLQRVEVGDVARFYSETPGKRVLDLEVVAIDRDATRQLSERMLASSGGGEIAVRDALPGQLVPDQAIYRVTLDVLDEPDTDMLQRGRVVIHGKPAAYIGRYVRAGLALAVRETGF